MKRSTRIKTLLVLGVIGMVYFIVTPGNQLGVALISGVLLGSAVGEIIDEAVK